MKNFVWGPVKQEHEIGEYMIIEYYPRIFKNGINTNKFETEKTCFHAYLNNKDTNHSYHTLDEALIGVIALKYDGVNSRAAEYFSKMIGVLS